MKLANIKKPVTPANPMPIPQPSVRPPNQSPMSIPGVPAMVFFCCVLNYVRELIQLK